MQERRTPAREFLIFQIINFVYVPSGCDTGGIFLPCGDSPVRGCSDFVQQKIHLNFNIRIDIFWVICYNESVWKNHGEILYKPEYPGKMRGIRFTVL